VPVDVGEPQLRAGVRAFLAVAVTKPASPSASGSITPGVAVTTYRASGKAMVSSLSQRGTIGRSLSGTSSSPSIKTNARPDCSRS